MPSSETKSSKRKSSEKSQKKEEKRQRKNQDFIDAAQPKTTPIDETPTEEPTPVETIAEEEQKAPEISEIDQRDAALAYLSMFIHQKEQWKFQKAKQIWIIKNMFKVHLFDDKQFDEMVCAYLENLQGQARSNLTEKAKSMVETYKAAKKEEPAATEATTETTTEATTEAVTTDEAAEETPSKPASGVSKDMYKRAKKIVKLFAAESKWASFINL